MRQFVWHEADSFLHRLNPLPKLALSVPVVILVTLANEPMTPTVVALAAILATRVLGRVPWASLLRPLGFAALLSLGMFWTGVLFYAGPGSEPGAADLRLGPARITLAGLAYGLTLAARLWAIFATSLLFVLTTNPVAFVLALIQQGRLPYRIGYGVFAAYRFVPLVEEELANVRAAHQVRNVGGGHGPLGRLRAAFGYAIPLLAIAVRRGERVALAMDSRAFGALPRRTYYRTTSLGRADALFAVGALIVLALVVALRSVVGGWW
ncbi:MAG: energy-coupling factor transporter transmembrane protein EcfT [Chloroflexota bacterium]|nr:energy-coupling factor transporter transmembrane protein EcfT [Chloroflexota bacterium]